MALDWIKTLFGGGSNAPGPGEVAALELGGEISQETKRLELRSRRRLTSDLIGEYRSAFRGSGLVVSDIRAYQPGDDVKHMHWKATARSGQVYVKSYEEERTLNVVLALDISRSLVYGDGVSKARRMREFASIVSLLAEQGGDALGLLLFSWEPEFFLAPKRKRSQYRRVLGEIARQRTFGPGTDLAKAITHLITYVRKRSIVFLVSDFFAEPFENELRALSLRHEVICVHVEDVREIELPKAGIVEFVDSESGSPITIDTSSARGRNALRALWERRRSELRENARRAGAEYLELAGNPIAPLLELTPRRKHALR